MNYAALIEGRKSVRNFGDREVEQKKLDALRFFYENNCHRLVPELKTELLILGKDRGKALTGAAGYEENPVGAPNYLVLLSQKDPEASKNGGYILEDLILKLEDLDLQSCWITFTDSEKVKQALGIDSPLEIAAIAAFGYGLREKKKMRFNILSMSCVDIIASRGYYAPKKDIRDLVFVDEIDNIQGLDEKIGFYEDLLWQAFYAVSKTPSYLNRQPFAFLLRDQNIFLVRMPDAYSDRDSVQLDLGIALLHFDVIAEQFVGKVHWKLSDLPELSLPEGVVLEAGTSL